MDGTIEMTAGDFDVDGATDVAILTSNGSTKLLWAESTRDYHSSKEAKCAPSVIARNFDQAILGSTLGLVVAK